MKKIVITAAAAAVIVAAPAVAQEAGQFYGTAGYTVVDGDDGTLGVLNGRLGYLFNQNFGIEGDVGFGVQGEEIGGASLDIETTFGAYVTGFLPVSEQVDLFARLGYQNTNFDASVGGFSGSEDFGGVAFGVGGQLMFTEQVGARLDYTRVEIDEDGVDGGFDNFGIALVVKF